MDSDFEQNSAEMNISCKEMLQDLSLHHVEPVMPSFPHVGAIPILDIDAIFRVQPMHMLLKGILRIPKERAELSCSSDHFNVLFRRRIRPG